MAQPIRGVNVNNVLAAFGQLQRANEEERRAREARDARRRAGVSQVFSAAGSIAGGLYAGPAGAAIGGAAGSAIASQVGGQPVTSGQAAQQGANIAASLATKQRQDKADAAAARERQREDAAINANRTTLQADNQVAQRALQNKKVDVIAVPEDANPQEKKRLQDRRNRQIAFNQSIDKRMMMLNNLANTGMTTQESFRKTSRALMGPQGRNIVQREDGSVIIRSTDPYTNEESIKTIPAVRRVPKGTKTVYSSVRLGKNDVPIVKSFATKEEAIEDANKFGGEAIESGQTPLSFRLLQEKNDAFQASQKLAKTGAARKTGKWVDISKVTADVKKGIRKEIEKADIPRVMTQREVDMGRLEILKEKLASGGLANEEEIRNFVSNVEGRLTKVNTENTIAKMREKEAAMLNNPQGFKDSYLSQIMFDEEYIDEGAVRAEIIRLGAIADERAKRKRTVALERKTEFEEKRAAELSEQQQWIQDQIDAKMRLANPNYKRF